MSFLIYDLVGFFNYIYTYTCECMEGGERNIELN